MRFFLLSIPMACLFFAGTLSAQTTVTYGYSGLPQPIFSNAADMITYVNVFVPQGIKMSAVTARVKIEYPRTGDLRVYLFSPTGIRTILTEHDCGDLANIDTTFSDSGPSAWGDFCPVEPERGPFRPDEPLSNFYGDDSAFGTWRLAVENDTSDSRTGWIREFSLTITGLAQTPVIRSETIGNAANPLASGSIAPGEMLSIYGVGVGPLTPVSAGSGTLPTSLGGSSVTINSTPVPISYASAYRLDVQAPFSLPPGDAQIQATFNGASTTIATVKVVDVSPGIYTFLPGGTGRITAVNQDGASNSEVTPAAKGSVITVYASGLGTVTPAVTEGTVPPATPVSNTTSPVTAVLGGLVAPVQFAGLAPGFPGLYQLNIQIPADAPSGTQELRIYTRGVGSQAGATVYVQ